MKEGEFAGLPLLALLLAVCVRVTVRKRVRAASLAHISMDARQLIRRRGYFTLEFVALLLLFFVSKMVGRTSIHIYSILNKF